MRSAFFWSFTQRRLVVPSRNVGTKLPFYAAQNCGTAQILYNLLQQGAVDRTVSSELHSLSLEKSIGLRKVEAKRGCGIQILTEPPVAKSLVYVATVLPQVRVAMPVVAPTKRSFVYTPTLAARGMKL